MPSVKPASEAAGLPTKDVKELGIWELFSDEDDGNPLGAFGFFFLR
jgi:hypothetical protein